jgi:transitional endoplasmic reticulum ATPase
MADLDPIRRALENSPDSIPLLLLYGQSCMDEWALEDARGAFQRVLERDTRNLDARLGLANVLLLSGKGSEAIVRLESLLVEQPRNVRALLMLARVHLGEGDPREARAVFRRARETDPNASDPGLERELGLDRRRPAEAAVVPPNPGQPAADPDSDDPFGGFDDDFGPFDDDSPFTNEDFERPQIRFDQVAGHERVKHELALRFCHPLRHPDLFRTYGRSAGGGILLYGPPGCGKTLLARATAGEAGARFVAVRPHQLLDMYIGNSEKNLHQVFELARENTPVVLFFDEIDALAVDRREARPTVPRSVVQQFLAELDSRINPNEGLLVVAATSSPWLVDAAFRRPGRFDRALYVGPPDEPARETLLRMMAADKPVAELDYPRLAALTEGFAACDLVAWFERAVERALGRAMAEELALVPLDTAAFLEVLPSVRASLPAWRARLERAVEGRDERWPLDEI